MEDVNTEGFDSCIVSTTPPTRVLHQALLELAKRWPRIRGHLWDQVAGNSAHRDFSSDTLPSASELDRASNWIHVNRDEVMERHVDEVCLAPMSDGEGAVQLLSTHYNWSLLLPRVTLPPKHENQDAWEGLLCCPNLYSYTVTTPMDPAEHPFSRDIYDLVLRLCRGG
jgi:hypothetical protein